MLILAIQAVVFAIFIFLKGEMAIGLSVLAAGIAFCYLFVYFYSKKRIKS